MLTPGCTVGNIKIGKLLGRGAMGEVYSGEQLTLRRSVAIKRIASHLADDDEIIQRFAREAQCVAKINSAHVVGVYEFGQFIDEQKDSHYLLVMELVEGGYDLKACIGTEISWQQASSVIMQVSEGLSAASEHDVIHRDIKPDNIMLSKKGVAKLADFGLAKSVDSTAMTMEGTLMGTPNYMPPEACRGEMVGAQGDIYSLGATWYHLITGMPLFTAANTMALLRAHCEEEPKHIKEVVAGIPDDVADFIMSCVAKKEEDRPESADAIYQFLMQQGTIPQKVPELIRIAAAAKERADNSASTMATVIPANNDAETFMASNPGGDAETIVTGEFQNNNQSDTATAINANQNTLMPDNSGNESGATIADSTSGQSGNTGGESKVKPSKAPLIGGAIFVLLMIAGVGFVLSKGTSEEPATQDDGNNTIVTKVTPTTHVGTQDTGNTNTENNIDTNTNTDTNTDTQTNTEATTNENQSVDLAGQVKAVNEALAAKEYSKALAAYAVLAKNSDEHTALQTQIKDGQSVQKSLSEDLDALHKKGHFAALDKKLTTAAAYPELKAQHTTLSEANVAFTKANANHLAKAELLVEQQSWSAADKIVKPMGSNADVLNAEHLKKVQALHSKIDPALKGQTALLTALTELRKQKHFAVLKQDIKKAEAYPELSKQVQAWQTEMTAHEKAVQKAFESAKTAVTAKQWTTAQEHIKMIDSNALVVGEARVNAVKQLQKDIDAGLKEQAVVAKQLKDLHASGHFVVLAKAIGKADAFPDLSDEKASYQKAIQAHEAKTQKALTAAQAAATKKDYDEAAKQADSISDDDKVVSAATIKAVADLRKQMREQGAAEVEAAIQTAIAGVEEGTPAGLKKSRDALRAAVPASKVSGMEDKLNSVMLKLVEIIQKRSEQE